MEGLPEHPGCGADPGSHWPWGLSKPAGFWGGIWGLKRLSSASGWGGNNTGRGCQFCPLPPRPRAA